MYRKKINSEESVNTLYTVGGGNCIPVLLEVGRRYQIVHYKPTTKKDRANNGRVVEVLGFTSDWFGDVIVKYLDNNRRGRVGVNCLLPFLE